METGPRMATAIGAGYLLGRTRKLRLALMLAFAGATGALEQRARVLLSKGSELVGSSAELEKIKEMRTDVVDAAKAAAIMAATKRIDRLSKHISPVNGQVGKAAAKTGTTAAKNGSTARRTVAKAGK